MLINVDLGELMKEDIIKFVVLTKDLVDIVIKENYHDKDMFPDMVEYFNRIIELKFSQGELITIPHEHLIYRNITFVIVLDQILKKIKPNQAAFDKVRDSMVAAYKDTLENIQGYYFKDLYKDDKVVEKKPKKRKKNESSSKA